MHRTRISRPSGDGRDGRKVNRISKEEGIKALGAKITMMGDDNAEHSHQLHRAWHASHKHKYILSRKFSVSDPRRADAPIGLNPSFSVVYQHACMRHGKRECLRSLDLHR